jgi:hypothetical protein
MGANRQAGRAGMTDGFDRPCAPSLGDASWQRVSTPKVSPIAADSQL